MACKAEWLSGARPRLVCRMTPVALITACRLEAVQPDKREPMPSNKVSMVGIGLRLIVCSLRVSSNSTRIACKVSGRPKAAIHLFTFGVFRSLSTEGSERRSDITSGFPLAALTHAKERPHDTQPQG